MSTSTYNMYLVAQHLERLIEETGHRVEYITLFPADAVWYRTEPSVSLHVAWEHGVDPDIQRRWAERFAASTPFGNDSVATEGPPYDSAAYDDLRVEGIATHGVRYTVNVATFMYKRPAKSEPVRDEAEAGNT